jgi:protein ImuB
VFWVCLHYPRLALEALHSDVPADRPHAVVDGPQQRRHVVLANAVAGKVGVRARQPLASAQLLCPRLAVTPRDEAAERQALASLADHAYRYSADVSIAGADTLFLEVGGSLKLFGGWPALERRMRADIDRLGYACTLAAAPTATAARVFAACRSAIALPGLAQSPLALDAAPIVASGLDAKIVAALHGMGMRTLGDLFRLPRAELARRIGQPALDHLDRMRGLVAETLPRWQPPPRYARRIEFGYGIESHTALAFPLQRLVREFAQFLAARDGGVQRFTVELGHERDAHTRIDIGLLAPQRDAASLLELARARLERVELVAPVHALALRADDLPPLCPLHRDLFEANRREQLDWPALAERLRARLGDAALQGIACVADHRPDRAWRFVALCANRPTVPATSIARPFWLLHRPLPLRGRPARVLSGPERIESGWWDEGDQRRDYYVIETRDGQRAWAFVETGQAPGRDAPWTLQGWFA